MSKLISGTAVATVTALSAVAILTGEMPARVTSSPPVDAVEEAIPTSENRPLLSAEGDDWRPREPFRVDLVSEADGPISEEGGDIEFCLPLMEARPRCFSRDDVLGLDERPMDRMSADGEARFGRVLMVHPTDFAEPEREVRTCAVFGRLKADNWGPMTTAGMAAEARFERYCGLKALARLAEPARTSRLSKDGLSAAELEAIAAADWPQLGEVTGFKPIFEQDADDPRRWNGSLETLVYSVHDVAVADFDGDGVAERLLTVAGRARGGSAGFASYMLMEHDDRGIGLRKVVWK